MVDLLDYDVRFGQGFLFSPPRPVRAEALQEAGGEATKAAPAAPTVVKPEPVNGAPAAPAPAEPAASARAATAAAAPAMRRALRGGQRRARPMLPAPAYGRG